MASTSQIIEALDSFPQGPAITEDLRARLDEITKVHAGEVPLHGRLLAQWLHFAFPHECPYPHMGGLLPKTQEQWRLQVGEEAESVSEDEVRQHFTANYARLKASPDAGKGMWVLKETLMESSTPSDDTPIAARVLRLVAMLGMVGAFAYMGFKEFRSVIPGQKVKAV